MKESSRTRASHVNNGTAKKRERSIGKRCGGREFRHPKLHAELEGSEATPYGGLSLAATLVRRLGLPQRLDEELNLLREHRPYMESDHVLTHVYNLYVGGSCIEDILYLQGSEAVSRMLGARRVPDPTTAGDFLRRFDKENLDALNAVQDEMHEQVWRQAYGRKKRKVACVDLDSHVKHIYGEQKEGADFTYKGGYGYHPLAITLEGSQEVLRLLNRWGNVNSSEGAGAELEGLFPLLKKHFKTIIVRGDSAFAEQEIFDVCEEQGQYFAMVSPEQKNFPAIAESLCEGAWEPFHSEGSQPYRRKKLRKRGKNLRRRKARERGKRDLKLQRQWVAEVEYEPARSESAYRLIIRRQKIEESRQGQLFTIYRYRYVLTNLPPNYSAQEAMRLTYRRCDQENVIEQLQNGISAMRMPTGSFVANSAFLVCARLAFNIKSWLAMLALPAETMRWEWKRFRLAFVYCAVRVVRKARQTIVRIADSHRFAPMMQAAIARLQV